MTTQQTGRIFISYRRADSAGYAGRIYDRLAAHFGKESIFMDVDTIEAGLDFVDVLENAVQSCNVLVVLIGRQWLNIRDEEGKQRLDNPQDFVRIEVAAALTRGIRVIPVLVDGTSMPNSDQLPDNLKHLARRNAVLVNHYSFHTDANRLIEHLELALKAAEETKILIAKELNEKETQKKRQVEIEKLLIQADIALDLKDWELAKEQLSAVLVLEPDHAQAQIKLAIAERKQREGKERVEQEAAKKAAREKAEAEQKAKEETDRLAKQKAEEERITKARLEEERLANEKAAAERKAKEEADRLTKQKDEEEQIAKARIEQERREKEKAKRKAAWKNARESLVYVIKNYYKPMLFFLGAALIIVIGIEIPKTISDNQPTFTPEFVHTSTTSFTSTTRATLTPTKSSTMTPSLTPEVISTNTLVPKKSLIIVPDNADQISEITRVNSTGTISDIQYTPDGSSLVVLTTVDLALYDSSSFVLEKQYTNISSGLSMAFTSDGEAVAVGTKNGTISLWRLSNGTKISPAFEGARKEVLSLDFSQNGDYLAAGSSDDNVYLWRASDGLLLYVLSGHDIDVLNVAFSPDSSILASEDGNFEIRLWQAGSSIPYKVIHRTNEFGSLGNGLAFSPNGDLLASSSSPFSNGKFDIIRLWKVSDGTFLQTFDENTNGILSLAFSPDGETLASGSWNGTISLWRVSDGKLLNILEGHTDYVRSVVFSPDGEILASESRDGTIRLWGIAP